MGGIADFFLGDKDPGKAPDAVAEDVKRAQLRAVGLQEQAIDDYMSRYGAGAKSVEDEADEGMNREMANLEGQRGDSQRQLQTTLAKRGLGPGSRSSIGEGLNHSQENDFQERKDAVRASIPQRIRQLREERSGKAVSIGSSVLGAQNAPIDFYGRPAERTGGILPILTGAAGAYLGGPAGAQVGYGLGQYAQGYNNSRYQVR